MLQGMEAWSAQGVTAGSGESRVGEIRGVVTCGPCTAASSSSETASAVSNSQGSADCGRSSSSHYRGRSFSLPTQAQSQAEYLQSIRALASAYSWAEQQRNILVGGASGAKNAEEPGLDLSGQPQHAMIDTSRNRMDSELTSDSERTYDLPPLAAAAAGMPEAASSEVFSPSSAEDERARIISRRLQELDSAQRSWKRRVADYVHGLPASRQPPGEAGRAQCPKRRRLWSTGCERLPWEISSCDGVLPRQRLYTVSSDSTFSQLSTASSRDSIQYWLDSPDGPTEDLDVTLMPGQVNNNNNSISSSSGGGGGTYVTANTGGGDKKREATSRPPAERKAASEHRNGRTKSMSGVAEDDLGLGADAKSVTGPGEMEEGKEADSRNAQKQPVSSQGGKILSRSLTNSDIINMAAQTKALQSRRKQLQRMGSSAKSDASMARVSDLLFARNDPEELLLSLGFGGGKDPDPLERIPARFLQKPSVAHGISVSNFLTLSETQNPKYGFSLQGGLRGIGAVLQGSLCAVQTSCLTLAGQDLLLSPDSCRLIEDPDKAAAPSNSAPSVEQSSVPERHEQSPRADREELGKADDGPTTPVTNRLPSPSETITPQTKDFSRGPVPADGSGESPRARADGSDRLGPEISPQREVAEPPASPPASEGADPAEGSPRSSEESRRARNARMVMPEPLLPPVSEELEVGSSAGPASSHRLKAGPSPDAGPTDQGAAPAAEEIGDPGRPAQAPETAEREEEAVCVERKSAAGTTAERSLRLTHAQESFEIEEISSTENQDEGYTAGRVVDKPPEKGALVRTDSAQSDSSGFADEVMDTTYTSTSPCMDDSNGHASPQPDYGEDGGEVGDGSRPAVGNKLIQTSFDDFGILESFEREEGPTGESLPARTATSSGEQGEEEKMSEKAVSLPSAERIARSRRSFRESRGSYDRMGSTFSGISISSLEDSPFDEDLSAGSTPVPRQRSGTFPLPVEKPEPPAGPKTVVEILTTLQENIKQASVEAKSLGRDEQPADRLSKKRPALSKMKSFDYFSADDVPSLAASVDSIVGRTRQPLAPAADKQETSAPDDAQAEEDACSDATVAAAEDGVAEKSVSVPPKLTKRKSSQIITVPTLPCLDEEKTPAPSRHTSVTDSPQAALLEASNNHSAIADEVKETDGDQTDQTELCHDDDRKSKQRSETGTPVSMIANADSIGDVGELEEEMRYLVQVESLLELEGRLLEEACLSQFSASLEVDEVHRPVPEKATVPDVDNELYSSASVALVHLNQDGTSTLESNSSEDNLLDSSGDQEAPLPFQADAVLKEAASGSRIDASTFLTAKSLSSSEPCEDNCSTPANQSLGLGSGESPRPPQEEAIASEVESSCHIDVRPACLLTFTTFNSSGDTQASPSFKEDQLQCKSSGTCLSQSATDEVAGIPATQASPAPQSSRSVQSSVCLYLLPPPFVIDVSGVASDLSAGAECPCESLQLCNCLDSERALPQRFRTSFELALGDAGPDEVIEGGKNVPGPSAAKVKAQDDLQDTQLAQRALLKYKQDLRELERLAEGLYSQHLGEGPEEGAEGEGEEWGELETVRDLRRLVLEEVEAMESQLAQRMRLAVTRSNLPDGLENSLSMTSEGSLEVIQDMVHLLEEQKELRRTLQDLEVTTHSQSPLSEGFPVPALSATAGCRDSRETCGQASEEEEEEGEEEVENGAAAAAGEEKEAKEAADDRKGLMEALAELKLELQRQRETAKQEINNAVQEMRQSILTELRQELHLDAELLKRQLQAKDREIGQLKTLLWEQRRSQEGE